MSIFPTPKSLHFSDTNAARADAPKSTASTMNRIFAREGY
jgi:hypothetical protein